MNHADTQVVKPSDGGTLPEAAPHFCILRSGSRPSCIFPYEGSAGDAFVADMMAAGWIMARINEYVLLDAPEDTNVVPFPLLHPLLRDCGGGA